MGDVCDPLGAAATIPSVAQPSASKVTITDIDASCSPEGQACGTLTVSNPVPGATVTLTLYANPRADLCKSDSFCISTGSTVTITVSHPGVISMPRAAKAGLP